LSERMVLSMENRGGKVQDRLYDHHKKQLNMKAHQEEQLRREAKENANPKILNKHHNKQLQ
jgi:hypothetical protein